MKIAVPIDTENINQHFGKSEKFLIATVEHNEIVSTETLDVASLQHNHDGLATTLVNNKVAVVITGGIGNGAFYALKQHNLNVFRGASGNAIEVINNYLNGNIFDRPIKCSHDHH